MFFMEEKISITEDSLKRVKNGLVIENKNYIRGTITGSYINCFEIGEGEDRYLGDGIYGGSYKIKTYKVEIEVSEDELFAGDWNLIKRVKVKPFKRPKPFKIKKTTDQDLSNPYFWPIP